LELSKNEKIKIDAYNDRGDLYAKLGQTNQVLSDFRKSVIIDPGQIDLKSKLSKLIEHT